MIEIEDQSMIRSPKEESASPLEPSTSKMEPISSSPVLVNLGKHSSLHKSLRQWVTVELDGVQIPATIRGEHAYIPVRWVETKLLAPFPTKLNLDIKAYTMISHRLSALEALVLNTVHGALFHFSMGFTLLTENDQVVAFSDVARFYWNVKAASLSAAANSLDSQLSSNDEQNVTLVATLSQLKQHIESDYDKACQAATRVNNKAKNCNGNESHQSSDVESPALSKKSRRESSEDEKEL